MENESIDDEDENEDVRGNEQCKKANGEENAERTTRKSLIFYSFNFLRVRINVTIISMEQRYTLTLSAVHI